MPDCSTLRKLYNPLETRPSPLWSKRSKIQTPIFALKILEDCEGDTEAALPAMIRALEDEDRIVRIAALEPVAAFGEKAMSAVPILLKWIESDDEFSRVSAAGHVLMIDPSKADEMIPVLEPAEKRRPSSTDRSRMPKPTLPPA